MNSWPKVTKTRTGPDSTSLLGTPLLRRSDGELYPLGGGNEPRHRFEHVFISLSPRNNSPRQGQRFSSLNILKKTLLKKRAINPPSGEFGEANAAVKAKNTQENVG
jgi:hypothetical protein